MISSTVIHRSAGAEAGQVRVLDTTFKGKHVFMEKPVASDAEGVRRVLAANQIAKDKNLKLA